MKRRIIEIDPDKCNGCAACAAACHEGAIAMVDGKAKLMRDDLLRRIGRLSPHLPHRSHYLRGTGDCRIRRGSRPEK